MRHSRRLEILLPNRRPSRLRPDASVVVLRALPGLGDFLTAVPALAALRRALPDGRLVLVGLEATRGLVSRYDGLVDELLAFPGHPDLPEQDPDWARIPAFYETVRQGEFDWAIQLHGIGWTVNGIVERFGAANMAGFRPDGRPAPDPATFPVWREADNETTRWLRLVGLLGIDTATMPPPFPVGPSDIAALAALPGVGDLGAAYAVIHPGASAPERRWSVAGFARVADELRRAGLDIVLTGTRAEQPITAAVARAMRSPALDLAGSTDVGALAALLAGARILLVNDTGVSHLAAALRVPSVVVFTATDPIRWAPPDRRLHRAAGPDVGVVLREVRELLGAPTGRAA